MVEESLPDSVTVPDLNAIATASYKHFFATCPCCGEKIEVTVKAESECGPMTILVAAKG